MSFIQKKWKAIVGTILSFLLSAAIWGITEWNDFRVFKEISTLNIGELKILAKETQESLKRIEIQIGRLEERIDRKNNKELALNK